MKPLPKESWPGLPKWPEMFLTGTSVTPEQAKEILFRTDRSVARASTYTFGGNDHRFAESCYHSFGWTKMFEIEKQHGLMPSIRASQLWADKMDMISTEYINNSFLSTAYIGGPHGWCNPSGQIYSKGHNIGKWPGVEEVVRDLEALLAAFPFIDAQCTLFSGEQCEDHTAPVITMTINSEGVKTFHPDLGAHCIPYDAHAKRDILENMGNILGGMQFGNYSYEKGWPNGWVSEFAERSRKVVEEVIADGSWLKDQ